MEILMTIMLLLVCLVISNIISHYVPYIPTALTQIALGIVVALSYRGFHLEIETEWFLLLFIAPLLYNDGRHFPRKELWKMRAPIFGNAIVLVLLTTIGGGYFIHWIIPAIPLAAAFALAAILSPTDPVAVNGIAKRVHIPEKVLNLVRGESLINDASGLVAFNYAVAAVVTGYFSLREAVFDFSYMFISGAILGLVLSLLLMWLRFSLRKKGINDVSLHSLLQILSPFLIFIVAEELHASGVIAVVVGGVVHSLLRERAEPVQAEEQVLTENIWTVVLFILNGAVFLLLGMIIPQSIRSTVVDPNVQNALAIGEVFAIGAVILAIRFVWSYLFSYYEYRFKRNEEVAKPTVKTTLLTSLTGVRGAVTMAGVLSIPLWTESGEAFPERSLILFLAAGVILFTLVAATIFLPLLSRGESTDGKSRNYLDLNEAKSRLLLSAINKIRSEMHEENEAASYLLMDELKKTFHQMNLKPNYRDKENNELFQKVNEVRLLALKAERSYIEEAMARGELDEDIFLNFLKMFELREEALSQNMRSRFGFLVKNVFREWKRASNKKRLKRDELAVHRQMGKEILSRSAKAALERLEGYAREHEEDNRIVYSVIYEYKQMIDRLKSPVQFNEAVESQKEELRIVVMDLERAEIRLMYENGEISNEQAKELRRMINYMESVSLYEHKE